MTATNPAFIPLGVRLIPNFAQKNPFPPLAGEDAVGRWGLPLSPAITYANDRIHLALKRPQHTPDDHPPPPAHRHRRATRRLAPAREKHLRRPPQPSRRNRKTPATPAAAGQPHRPQPRA